MATDLCFNDFIGAASVNLTGRWSGTFDMRFVGNPSDFEGSLTFNLDQNQNAITGTYVGAGFGGFTLAGTVSATLVTTGGTLELQGLELTETNSFTSCTPRGGEFSGGSATITPDTELTFMMNGSVPTASGCVAESISGISSFSLIGPSQ